jgi:hypothetical protein
MRVVREHLRGNMPRNRHNGLVTGLRLGKLSYSVMPKIMESKPGSWTFLFADIGFALLVATRFAGVL